MSADRPSPSDTTEFRKSAANPENPFDIKNPQVHVSDEVFDIFREMRAEGPLHWQEEIDDRGFWAVLGHDEATYVQQNPEIYSADKRNGGNRIFDDDKVTGTTGRMVLMIDPPDLTDLRKAIASSFTPAAVAGLEPRLRTRAERLVSHIESRGSAEFVSEVSGPFTTGLATDLFGIPEEMGSTISEWVSVFIADDDPEVRPSADRRGEVIAEFDEFAMRLYTGETRTSTDLVSNLKNVKLGGVPFDFEDFSVNFLLLFAAMTDTTRHALTYSILALGRYPEQRQLLQQRPDLMSAAVKEFIRWASPLIHVRRTAMRDTVLGGQRIRTGDKVVVWYAAANRDPTRFHHPDSFDIKRFEPGGAPASLGFGAGPHFCLGWRYAELEIAIMLRTLMDRIPDIRPAGEAERFRSNFIRGIKKLPVEFTAARS